MAKKKNNKNNENNNNNNNESKNEGEIKKKEGGDAEKKKDEKSPPNVVLKVEIHCEGCASKIVKCVRGFEGVESAKADMGSNKLTVVGAVDPSKIRDKLEQKIKKKVDLISPQPKKDKDKENAPKPDNQSKDKPSDDKKPKEPPVTTAVLKLALHCQGCIEKINKIVLKTKGVLDMAVDRQKDLVTVKGTMDAKALAETLKERLKRPVEIVPPKKEKEEKESNGGGKKKKKGGGGDEGGEDDAENGGGGGGGGRMEGNRMEHMVGLPGLGYGYPYPLSGYPVSGHEYGYPYPVPVGQMPPHAPQMFSDENPNACSLM
ncbi:heavy metal-associated isoprenylated plant protein 3-like [Pistacia vera]|uniref:Uncharacterized protein n=1 Tax=Pistacia atlantica TaxID=434234 RepID=A0ACC1A821_9ROSI|nr:heavy metal-associated isoprenylated plant protein 3-like [Pistacia vera]KAJ0083660.1 hypothetical protein Patl1_30602 [Pistacia atlantica]